MDEAELKEILHKHSVWLQSDGKEGGKANLSEAILKEADLTGAYLFYADLTEANLTKAKLDGAIMPEGWKEVVSRY